MPAAYITPANRDRKGRVAVPLDHDPLDHAANDLTELRAARPHRVAQETLDLVAHRLDHGFDFAGDLGRLGDDRVVDRRELGLQAVGLRFQIAELGDQRGTVAGVDDRVDDTSALRLGPIERALEFGLIAV